MEGPWRILSKRKGTAQRTPQSVLKILYNESQSPWRGGNEKGKGTGELMKLKNWWILAFAVGQCIQKATSMCAAGWSRATRPPVFFDGEMRNKNSDLHLQGCFVLV